MICFSILAQAGAPKELLATMKRLYPLQSEAFLVQRISLAKTPQDKWRDFPPYYHDLLSRMRPALGSEFFTRKGFCAGDAHIDNFGFLFGSDAVFTLNDLDDAAPCPLNADLMRLFISHKLVSPHFETEHWLHEYQRGFDKVEGPGPSYLEDLAAKSRRKGLGLPSKFQSMLEQKICKGDYSSMTAVEVDRLREVVSGEGRSLVFSCARTKLTGGSAGARRFLAITTIEGRTEAVEYKPLLTPAPWFGSLTQATRIQFFNQSVSLFLGSEFEKNYRPIIIGGELFQRRSLWAGNVGVDYEDISEKDLDEVFYHEARVLGSLHRKSSQDGFNLSPAKWDEASMAIMDQWKREFP